MTKRIFHSIISVSAAVLIASVILIFGVFYSQISNDRLLQLESQAKTISAGIALSGTNFLENIETKDYRVTYISETGEVLFDSEGDFSEMENHLEREEIAEAAKDGKGESRRLSKTLSKVYIYYAKKLPDGSFIRLSVTRDSVFAVFSKAALPAILIIFFAFLLSVFAAKRLSKKIVEPLNTLDLDNPLENKNCDEVAPLLRRISAQQKELKKQEEKLRKKKNELETVLENMDEGIILLTFEGKIVSINSAAKRIFGCSGNPEGENLSTVCRDVSVTEAFSEAASGRHFEKNAELSGGYFRIDANPVYSGEKIFGVALFLFDVTEKEDSEQMRREFTANVSHELKTPLHSITGFSELMASGIMKQEDYIPCAKRIHDEAKRMTRLIEDIISLSHLDENAHDMKREKADLFAVCKNVIKNLDVAVQAMEVEISLSGEKTEIEGIPELLEAIVFNLCDNAIKYNRRGGKVFVSVCKNKKEAVLSVKDTGIGIPPEHRERIFERFYRVDKSHSKEVGGTGLGLSIVKHAAKVHNAKIELESKPGEGTTVTLIFSAK
ncbi:MAG: PAS domain-containing protein [Oscillospiraceae bacterium]|nr:PAS domain-containing protein [Oscillospiraceae bacterium]